MKKVLIGIILLFCVSAANALQWSAIESQVRLQVADVEDTTNNNRYTSADLMARANMAQNDIAFITRCLYTQYSTATVADTQEYRKPPLLITIDRVSVVQSTTTAYWKKLNSNTMPGLDRDKMTWESYSAGPPTDYYERGDYIGLVPKPSSTYAYDTGLKIDYYKLPDEIDDDADEPFDGVYYLRPYHNLIVLGVVIMCKKDEGDWSAVQVLQAEYASMLNLMMESLRLKPDGRIQHIKFDTK